jgi:phenylalanyl-tRNA synthetase alpha chain
METIKEAQLQHNLKNEQLDVNLPGRAPARGRLHIQTAVLREVCQIFVDMGFQVYRTVEVESDEYNFELLNMPLIIPRAIFGTLSIPPRTASSCARIPPGSSTRHARPSSGPDPRGPAGMCYRYEQMDASHEIQFNQIELLVVGKDITFANMKGTLEEFAKRMYGKDVRTRIRPSYFPLRNPVPKWTWNVSSAAAKAARSAKAAVTWRS